MISSIAASGLIVSSKKTFFRLFTAPNNAVMGDVSMTAPSVPPSTMIAAVTCVMSDTLPPSSTNPPIMPPSAMASPRILAKSGRVDRRFNWPPDFFSAIGPWLSHCNTCGRTVGGYQRGMSRLISKERLPETHYPFDNLFGGLQNHIFLPRRKRDHRIRRHLDVFN